MFAQNCQTENKRKRNVSKRCEMCGSLGGLIEKGKTVLMSSCALRNALEHSGLRLRP